MTADKANFSKLFRAMRDGRENITHMAQMLGEPFIVTVVHAESGEGDKKRTFANIRGELGWMIEGPYNVDNLTGERTPLPIAEPLQALQLLLWDTPSKAQWDSIFIDGTRTVKDDKGVEREVSRNWLQEDIIKNALDFKDSELSVLLSGFGELTLDPDPSPASGKPAGEPEQSATQSPSEPAKASTAPAGEASQPGKSAAPAEQDPDAVLAALGF